MSKYSILYCNRKDKIYLDANELRFVGVDLTDDFLIDYSRAWSIAKFYAVFIVVLSI
ncbi:hypothetical protein [Pedobacter sp. UC225_65]|uniref:hypothetical protein n=1 Tax=Pedobacter sp. UC225_65 TaxID=3350173 RepID=UPI00366C02D7